METHDIFSVRADNTKYVVKGLYVGLKQRLDFLYLKLEHELFYFITKYLVFVADNTNCKRNAFAIASVKPIPNIIVIY